MYIIFVSFWDLNTSEQLGQYHDMYQLFYASDFNFGFDFKEPNFFFNISKEITICFYELFYYVL